MFSSWWNNRQRNIIILYSSASYRRKFQTRFLRRFGTAGRNSENLCTPVGRDGGGGRSRKGRGCRGRGVDDDKYDILLLQRKLSLSVSPSPCPRHSLTAGVISHPFFFFFFLVSRSGNLIWSRLKAREIIIRAKAFRCRWIIHNKTIKHKKIITVIIYGEIPFLRAADLMFPVTVTRHDGRR